MVHGDTVARALWDGLIAPEELTPRPAVDVRPLRPAAGSVLHAAAYALGLRRIPIRFASRWPAYWFARAGRPASAGRSGAPDAADAAAVIGAVVDGRIDEALLGQNCTLELLS